MVRKLYFDKVSPPSRATLMCAKAIGLNLDVIEMSVFNGDQYKPEFIKVSAFKKCTSW